MKLFRKLAIATSIIISGTSLVTFSSNSNNNIDLKPQMKSAIDVTDPAFGELDTDVTVTISQANKTYETVCYQIAFRVDLPKAAYFIGDGTSAEDEKPASLVYEVKHSDGSITQEQTRINKKNVNGYSDYLGLGIGESVFTTYIDIQIKGDAEVLTDNMYLINIFKCEESTTGKYSPIPNEDGTNKQFYCVVNYNAKEFLFENIIELEYKGFAAFGNYASYTFVANSKIPEIYSSLNSTTKRISNNNSERMAEGSVWIRTAFSFVSESRIRAFYKDSERVESFRPNAERIFITEENSNFTILAEKFPDLGNIDYIDLSGYYVYADAYDNETHRSITSSSYTIRFSSIDFKMKDVVGEGGTVLLAKSDSAYNLNLILIFSLSLVGFFLIFYGISFAVYFIRKKKYQFHEFKRVRPKEYWKTNTMFAIFGISALIMTEMIVFRTTVFDNSFQVFNPTDVLIVIFGVLTIIFGGYFIKYYVQMFKDYRKKKEMEIVNAYKSELDDEALLY